MISIQIGFYANTSQRPILKEIGLILNNKIRKRRNIRSTISRCRALFLFLIIKKIYFYHPFWYEERQERGNYEPLVSLGRPGSAEQAQFFRVFRSNGGKQEATVRCESRLRGVEKKNTCAPQNRRNLLRFSDKQRQVGSEHEDWVTHGRRSTKKER